MIGILAPNVIERPRIAAPGPNERLYSVALCGKCGTGAGSPMARLCTEADCGLAARHHGSSFSTGAQRNHG